MSVVWEPFAIAVVFGLVVSAGLYFIVMWPQVEPDDEADDAPAVEPARTPVAEAGDAATPTEASTSAAVTEASASALSSEHGDAGDPPAA